MKRSNKRILIFVVIVLVIGFVMATDIGGVRTSIQKKLNSLNLSGNVVSSSNDYCKENIIPDNVTLHGTQLVSGIDERAFSSGVVYLEEPVWKDKTPFGQATGGIPFSNPYNCRMGKQEDENVNYLYCNSIGYGKQVKSMDSSGNILKIEDINYRIDLVINTKDILGTRTLTTTDMYGFARNVGELTFNRVVDYKCKRIN